MRRHKIPKELVVNFDQTGVHLVPTAGGRTYAPTGQKEIILLGQEDKRQMTGMHADTWYKNLHIFCTFLYQVG